MLAQQFIACAAFLLTSTFALPQPVRRQISQKNSTTINGTTYTLTEVGARNTLVRLLNPSKLASKLKAYVGLASVARTGREPCVLLA